MGRMASVIVLLLIGIGGSGCAVTQPPVPENNASDPCVRAQGQEKVSPYSLDELAYRYECQRG